MREGKAEVKTEQMDLPPDLANGLMSLAVQNFPANATEMRVSYLTGTRKPRLVKLSIRPDGVDRAYVGGGSRRAKRFNVHVEIGGLAGGIAPVIGKQPPDIKLWVMDGEVPAFLKMKARCMRKGQSGRWPSPVQAGLPSELCSSPEVDQTWQERVTQIEVEPDMSSPT